MQNFNIFPFNDDFDETKHFYKVVYRPAVAIQTRELNQMNSIVQQQVKNLGDSLYKHGSMVIPGQIATDPNTNYVLLLPTYNSNSIDLDLFANQIVQGQTSGLQAQVVFSTIAVNNDPPTLYVKYMNSGVNNGETAFIDGEFLTLLGSETILAQLQSSNSTGSAISAQIDGGVYYMWGYFVRVEKQYLLLNKYSNTVTTRVGLQIVESIITPEEDLTLTDNARNSPNYQAPGAYRYKIDLILENKDITDTTNDDNFVELVRLINSLTQAKVTTDTYSIFNNELALRSMDANGDFTVRNFSIDVREHLDTSFITSGIVTGATIATDTPSPATLKLASGASNVDDTYNNFQVYLSNGSGAGQTFTITDYTGSTRTAVLDQDYIANQVADTTTSYLITDPTKINRGINPPAPFGDGSIDKLAVGLESGRAYVDGFRIDTLSTIFVDVDKARDSIQSTAITKNTPIGNFVLVKNLTNIPLAASVVSANYLTINFSNKKADGTFNLSTNGLGTARVYAVEYFEGTNVSTSDALFKMYLFDVTMNSGADINSVRSFFLTNDGSHNNLGNGLNAWGDICTLFGVSNVNGTGLAIGATLTSGIGTETLVYYDAINSNIITEPNDDNGLQILANGVFTAPSSTTGTLVSRSQIFNTQASQLVFSLSPMIKTIRAANNTSKTNYAARKMLQATRDGSGLFTFNTSSNAPFAPFNPIDYMACVATSSHSPDIGKFIDLTQYISSGSFTGSPANTTLSFSILSGIGSTAGCTINLMTTLHKTGISEKIKTLTSTEIAYAVPTAKMSLGKADIIDVLKIIDSGDPAVNADPSNPAHLDIKNRYVFDRGQRDYYYDIGSVLKYPTAPAPSGRILILFTYYAHSGSGDYFSVDSYTGQIDYSLIPSYTAGNGHNYVLRDCLDFRPRKDDSQFGFAESGSSFSSAITSNDIVTADFQSYTGRIDKIYLDQYGNFNVIKGTSALIPIAPSDPIDGMMLYTLNLNPYTVSTKDLVITPTSNPRYTMHDIGKLEDRIANLEYYANLNELEQKTATLQITDTSTGLDRFKNGFVVDNFQDHSVGNVFDLDYNCAVDPTTGNLRPVFIQNNISMSPSGIYMLPYTEVVSIEQPFPTDIININPFSLILFQGNIELIPPSDSWKSTIQLPNINVSDNTALVGYTLNKWSNVTWGDWQTTWVGQPTTIPPPPTVSGTIMDSGGGSENVVFTDENGQYVQTDGPTWLNGTPVTSLITLPDISSTTSQSITQTQSGTQSLVTAQLSSQTINNVLVDESLSPYIRSRRVKIIGRHFKPNTRLYPLFDAVDVSAFCRPFADPIISPTVGTPTWVQMDITWGGDFSPQTNADADTSSGSTDQTSNLLVGPLADPIITTELGNCTLFFEIPCTDTVEFKTGARIFRLTSNPTNALTPVPDSSGETPYQAVGVIDQYQETITSVFTPKIVTQQLSSTQTTDTNVDLGVIGTSNVTPDPPLTPTQILYQYNRWKDPLAQSFLVKEFGGAYISSIDVYFQTRDNTLPVTLQLRNMVNGYPGPDILPFSEKTLYPDNLALSAVNNYGIVPAAIQAKMTSKVINVSDDATIATSFIFDLPVFVSDGTEYAIVLISDSVNYFVYTAIIGSQIIGSKNIVSVPPYLGNLFKSQNSSTWVADPTQNMRFVVNKAQFNPTSETISFVNQSVQPDILSSLPFQTINGSNIVRVFDKAHMMAKGQLSNSVVTLSNIAVGTYNGLTNVQLSGTFPIDNINLNSFTITVPGTPAIGTGRVGPDSVVATRNYQFDSICPIANVLAPSGTSVTWQAKFVSGKSVNNNSAATQEPYIPDTDWIQIPVNITTDFTSPRMISSDINETTNKTGKSCLLNAILSTTNPNLSPVVDATRLSLVLANNQIDDPTFANYTIENMDKGVVVTSSSSDNLTFDSRIILTVIAVTGGQFLVHEPVTGAVSGAQGTVVSWDGTSLVLSGAVGIFQLTEAISGADAIGTIQDFQYINTITNPSGVLDFAIFSDGTMMTIDDVSNVYGYDNPVTILDVTGNVITVDANPPFVHAVAQANVALTPYVRYIAESGPINCTTASRYITRPFTLTNPANSLHIGFTINRPPGSFVDCYYRILKTNSTQSFNTVLWKKAELDGTVDNGESSDPTQFKDYTYTVNNIGSFITFSVKLVMRGGNSSLVPKVQDFRAIALAL